MSIEEQVLSREQMAHLVELGVDISDASMCWTLVRGYDSEQWAVNINNSIAKAVACINDNGTKRLIPTYTINDLINKLPKQLYDEKSKLVINTVGGKEFYAWYGEIPETIKKNSSLLNTLYKLLCWGSEKHKDLLASN